MKQTDYQMLVFLNQCIYHDLSYPDFITLSHKSKKLSGLSVEMFEYENYDVIVFCGSNDWKDWLNNFLMIFGRKPKTFSQALEFVVKNYSFERPLYLTGHSLGGAIASYLYLTINKNKVRCITFNSCGVSHFFGNVSFVEQPKHLQHYITTKDILNRITHKLPFNLFKHFGKINYINDDLSKNGIQSHSNFNVFMSTQIAENEVVQ